MTGGGEPAETRGRAPEETAAAGPEVAGGATLRRTQILQKGRKGYTRFWALKVVSSWAETLGYLIHRFNSHTHIHAHYALTFNYWPQHFLLTEGELLSSSAL